MKRKYLFQTFHLSSHSSPSFPKGKMLSLLSFLLNAWYKLILSLLVHCTCNTFNTWASSGWILIKNQTYVELFTFCCGSGPCQPIYVSINWTSSTIRLQTLPSYSGVNRIYVYFFWFCCKPGSCLPIYTNINWTRVYHLIPM